MNFDDSYSYIDKIDFLRIHVVFRGLPLFDDMFLNMQAINIAIVDSFISQQPRPINQHLNAKGGSVLSWR
jgi:hypothetical protein